MVKNTLRPVLGGITLSRQDPGKVRTFSDAGRTLAHDNGMTKITALDYKRQKG